MIQELFLVYKEIFLNLIYTYLKQKILYLQSIHLKGITTKSISQISQSISMLVEPPVKLLMVLKEQVLQDPDSQLQVTSLKVILLMVYGVLMHKELTLMLLVM